MISMKSLFIVGLSLVAVSANASNIRHLECSVDYTASSIFNSKSRVKLVIPYTGPKKPVNGPGSKLYDVDLGEEGTQVAGKGKFIMDTDIILPHLSKRIEVEFSVDNVEHCRNEVDYKGPVDYSAADKKNEFKPFVIIENGVETSRTCDPEAKAKTITTSAGVMKVDFRARLFDPNSFIIMEHPLFEGFPKRLALLCVDVSLSSLLQGIDGPPGF